MAAAAAEQRHASAGLAQDPSLLQPPDLLRTMAADGGLDDIPDPTAMTDSQRARMAEELIQRTLAEPSPDDPVFVLYRHTTRSPSAACFGQRRQLWQRWPSDAQC